MGCIDGWSARRVFSSCTALSFLRAAFTRFSLSAAVTAGAAADVGVGVGVGVGGAPGVVAAVSVAGDTRVDERVISV